MNRIESKFELFPKIKQRLCSITKSINPKSHIALLVLSCLLAIYGFSRIMLPQGEAAQVRFVETRSFDSELESSRPESQIKNPFSGAEYENAVRLRETSALGMAITLSVISISARAGRLPENVNQITQHLVAARMLPPGFEANNGNIASEQSIFQIGYRREPFSFEVRAVPNSDQGSQLLFRFPLPQGEPNTVIYFEALRDKAAPAQFSSTEQLSSSGWKIRHWRGDALALNSATIDSLKEQSRSLNNVP